MRKSILKAKEPVRIRFKKLAKGNLSIYLDKYTEGHRSYEFLKMYLVPEIDENSKLLNANTMRAANTIKARRIIDMINERAGISQRGKDMLLCDYVQKHKEDSRGAHRGNSYAARCKSMENHLYAYLKNRRDKIRMRQIDVDLCRGFLGYLRGIESNRGRCLSEVSIHHYFSAFRNILSAAVADGVLVSNPIDRMKRNEIPSRPAATCEYLDACEIARMSTTACRNEMVKQAFLFSCFTGLRISDVRALRWDNIRMSGDEWRLSLVMKKTQRYISCKLSKEAISCIPSRRDNGAVFHLPCTGSVERIIAQWVSDTGISKHVTFHTARHSYATMALRTGTDLYTISKLLGHRSIATTTIYATVVDQMRDEATDKVGQLVLEQLNKRDHKQML